MNVRIVFSDGSRAMAQNTNDLYERWQLRYEASQSRVYSDNDVIPIPKALNKMTSDQLLEWRSRITLHKKQIIAMSANHNTKYEEMPRRIFKKQRALYRSVITYYDAAFVLIKNILRESGLNKEGHPIEHIQKYFYESLYCRNLLREHEIEIDFNDMDKFVALSLERFENARGKQDD